MTIYLKDHSLTHEKYRSFLSVLGSFGAVLEHTTFSTTKLIRVIAPVHVPSIRLQFPDDQAENVEHACHHFGFTIIRGEPSPLPVSPARQDLFLCR